MPGAKVRLLQYFVSYLKKPLSKEDLAKVAGVHDWARNIRTLRQEGWDIHLIEKGEHRGCYVMKSVTQKRGNLRGVISQKTRYRILQRDNSTCQRCGISLKDGAKMMVDHKIPVDLGGETVDENLWTFCKEGNLGKKHWFKDIESDVLKEIFKEKSAYKRIKRYFQECPNELIIIANLDLVSGIRDWERTLRYIRSKEKMDIRPVRKNNKKTPEGYIYRKN